MACSSAVNDQLSDVSMEVEREGRIFMTVYWSNDAVGMAYYGTEDCVLYMMTDTPEIMGANVFKRAYLQIMPDVVLACPKDKEKILAALKETKPDDEDLEKNVQVLPSVDFSDAACKQRLTLMNLPNVSKDLTESEKSIYISTLVQPDNINMTKCVGALLHFLEKNRISVELESELTQVPIAAFKIFKMLGFPEYINKFVISSLTRSLQIFKEETHPSGLANHTKEGHSLFSHLKRCKSTAGANMMKLHWFKHPLSNLEAISCRLDTVGFLLHNSNYEFASYLESAIKNVKNIDPLLKRMVKSQCRYSDWKVLQQTLVACLEVNGLLIKAGYPRLEVFSQLKDIFESNELIRLCDSIAGMVDLEETNLNQRFTVKPNVSPELDMKKHILDDLSTILTEVCARERASLDPSLKDCNVVYFPQIGYLLTITPTQEMEATKDYSLPGKDFMFIANGTVYYKSQETKNLDCTYGDLRCDIIDIETRHMDALQGEVIRVHPVISRAVACIAELDWINDYVRPDMIDEPVIEILNGRHPLLESLGTFIANDTCSSYPGKVHVITGANASGKSVYMKQIGLIVFMAHLGCYVPAEKARIGMVDQIFTKMYLPRSVSLRMSSFLMDINQLSVALRMATDRSLLLVDEFGIGTQEEDGASLLAATIRHLDRLASSSPHSFISTHFHIINEAKLLPPSDNIKYLRTRILVEGEDKVTYLYNMEEGIAESSYALAVAQAVGLPEGVLKRARQILQCMNEGKAIAPLSNRNVELNFKKCQRVCDMFLQFDFDNRSLSEFMDEYNRLRDAPETEEDGPTPPALEG